MSAFGSVLRVGARWRALRSTTLAAAVVALAAGALTAAITVRQDASHVVDAAFAAHHGPDLVVTTSASALARVQQALATDPRVVEVAPARRVVDARAEIGSERVAVTVNGIDGRAAPSLNPPVLTAGRLPIDETELTFDAAAAADEGIAPGDRVEIRTPSARRTFTIVGLAYDFTDCLFPTCDPARAWVIDRALSGLDARPAVLLAAKVARPELADAVGRRVVQAAGGTEVGFDTWPDTRGDLLAESSFFAAFLGAFGVVALVAAIVVVAGVITARTWSRRRALAQLRSLGCTRRQVTAALLVEHVLIGSAGCGAGIAAGALLAPRLRVGALGILDGARPALALSTIAEITTLVLAVIALATLVPAIRAGRHDVVAGLAATPGRPGAGGVLAHGIERVPLPVSGALGVRTALTRPLLATLVAISIGLAVATTVVALSINGTMNRMIGHPELTGDPADLSVEPSPGTSPQEAAHLLDTTPGVARWFSVADTRAAIGDRSVHVRAIGGDPASAGQVIGRGSPLLARGQAIAGYGLAKVTGWRIGQMIQLHMGGRTVDVTMVGWYRETEDSGEVLQIRMEDLAMVDAGIAVRFAVIADEGTTASSLEAALTRSFGTGASIQRHGSDAADLAPFRVALATMAALIGAVALANMVAIGVVTSRERARRVGALRALGMTQRSIVAEAVASAAVPLVAAIAIGLPLGLLGARVVVDALTTELGAGPGLLRTPSPALVAVLAVLAAATAVVVAAAAVRPVARRAIPELLHERW